MVANDDLYDRKAFYNVKPFLFTLYKFIVNITISDLLLRNITLFTLGCQNVL